MQIILASDATEEVQTTTNGLWGTSMIPDPTVNVTTGVLSPTTAMPEAVESGGIMGALYMSNIHSFLLNFGWHFKDMLSCAIW